MAGPRWKLPKYQEYLGWSKRDLAKKVVKVEQALEHSKKANARLKDEVTYLQLALQALKEQQDFYRDILEDDDDGDIL